MNHLVKYARWYWVFWVLVAFLVPELVAVFDKTPGDTFSESWWSIFGVLGHAPAWWHITGALITIVTGVWLTGHLAFGWWGGPTPFGRLPKGQLPKGTAERIAAQISDSEDLRRMYEMDPPSTITRLMQGQKPDADGLVSLLAWLNADSRQFTKDRNDAEGGAG